MLNIAGAVPQIDFVVSPKFLYRNDWQNRRGKLGTGNEFRGGGVLPLLKRRSRKIRSQSPLCALQWIRAEIKKLDNGAALVSVVSCFGIGHLVFGSIRAAALHVFVRARFQGGAL